MPFLIHWIFSTYFYKMSYEKKKYAVVKFLCDSSYSEIPTTWLFQEKNIQYCWWPPRTANSATLILNCESPDFSSWKHYEVNIIKHCTTIESARKCAADSNYETTDEERLGRGKRQPVLNSRFANSDSEDEDFRQPRKFITKKQINKNCAFNKSNIGQAPPPAPSNLDFMVQIAEEKDTVMEDEENERPNIFDAPIIIDNTPMENVEDVFNVNVDIQQMLRMQAASNVTQRQILQRLVKIENALKNRALSPNKIKDDLIKPYLPLTTVAVIKEFDALLKASDDAVIQFKEFLSKTGGNNARDNILRILKKTFTNQCSMGCSWKGLRQNFQVSNLHLIQIIKKEVIARYTTFTEAEFENVVAEWLRFAKQRNDRERAKENIEVENN
ncbi:uncharacterized protein LOC120358125 [Solenopsis invicta]|uniref:uncharacterized protein LOC120358125 n=1 Tax=Solenopsis invicta TaxID=13686 RepID=UPI00193E80E9|nr:uncharacterized protein LOC120358125 [Solenopsis invicta]